MEEDVRFAVDAFNRFRRPDVEARLVGIENNTVDIEFIGGREQIEHYVRYFKDKLESAGNSVEIESIEKNGTCTARFSVSKTGKKDEDPLQKALKIMGRYYEGAPKSRFGFED